MRRAIFWQAVLLTAVVAISGLAVAQVSANVAQRSIPVGFAFLDHPASFEIGESFIAFAPSDSYLRAVMVGVVNTLDVSGLGIIFATVIGASLGFARSARNALVRLGALIYVEAIRNTPLLLQLLIWYGAIFAAAPLPHDAWQPLPSVFICDRGIIIPWIILDPSQSWGWRLDMPVLGRFNFSGGLTLPPELMALLAGLSVYTAAYIAEIVRGGIAAVSTGQAEAAAALGLSRRDALRYVIWPQALRVILPSLVGQFLNLIKNSSLALAIGFPDIVAVANTMINQTGQAIEGVAIILIVYLAINLIVSAAMSRVNRHFASLGTVP